MSFSKKTTVIIHIFNEEYLLPFWLSHHKDIFDDIIVIDYNSTDKSSDICKSICPDCKIIKTRNDCFDAEKVDAEVMDIENNIEGIKIVLNVTEFLFCEIPIKDLFQDNPQIIYSINTISPYSVNNYDVTTNYELFNNLLNDDVVYHRDRFTRYLHDFPNGKYTIGRHNTNITPVTTTERLHIVWFGHYPMNEKLLKRKLQIQNNIPQSDKEIGRGYQHLFSIEKILSINREKALSGLSLKNINPQLYNLLFVKLYN